MYDGQVRVLLRSSCLNYLFAAFPLPLQFGSFFIRILRQALLSWAKILPSWLFKLVSRSITKYLSLSVVNRGQVMLLAVGGGKWGSRLLGSLLETKLKKTFSL